MVRYLDEMKDIFSFIFQSLRAKKTSRSLDQRQFMKETTSFSPAKLGPAIQVIIDKFDSRILYW